MVSNHAPALDTEVLVEEGAVEALDSAIGLWPLDPRGAVFDVFELQEEFVRMLVGPATELAAIVGEHDLDLCIMVLEGWDDIVVQGVNGGDRQLRGIEPGPGVARMAVDGGLEIDLADALEGADEEGVDSDKTAGVRGFDVAFAELGAEAFEEPDLLLLQLDLALGGGLLQPEQPLVLGEQVMALPHPAHATGGDLYPFQPEFLFDPCCPMAGVLQGMVENGRLDLHCHSVGMWPLGARHVVK